MLHEQGLPRRHGGLPQQAEAGLARPLGPVLFATLGSLGDLNPYIAVGRALVARGVEAVVATAADYHLLVERWGIRHTPLGPGYARFLQDEGLLRRLLRQEQFPAVALQDMALPDVAAAHAQLTAAAQGASLIVAHPHTAHVVARVAEEKAVPWAGTALGPTFISLGGHSPHLNLGLFDAPLAAPGDGPPGLRLCGAPLHDDAVPAETQRALAAFLAGGDAPIVFTLGSFAAWVAGDFWRHAIGASRALGRRALLIAGRDARTLGTLPPGIRAISYLPYSMVFPHAAAIVHQGGIGTLSLAMRSGRPQLITPFAFDQFDNARRGAALGLARLLPLKQLDAASLTSELKALLDSGSHQERARRIADELRAVDGAGTAADALLTLCR